MELIAISLARVAAFLELQSLDPRGQTSTPDGFKALATRYSFTKIPQKYEEFDFQKGAEFLDGKFEGIVIERLTLFNNGVAIDTRSSTENCAKVLDDLLNVVRERYGAAMAPTRRLQLSQIIFRSGMKFSTVHPTLQPIADQLTASVSGDLGQPVLYDIFSIGLSADLSQIKLTPSQFTIERRVDTPFGANIYFSSAPLSTTDHIALIEKFETAMG